MSASMARVGVVRTAHVIPKQARHWILLSFFLALAVWQPGHHTKDAKVTDGLLTQTQSQWTTLGPRPHAPPQALLQAHKEFWAKTVRLVAQCLNHYATPGPILNITDMNFKLQKINTMLTLTTRASFHYSIYK